MAAFGRFAPTLVLLLQLQPVVLPALCGWPDRAPGAACEEPLAPSRADVVHSADGNEMPCANPALCGVPGTAIAHSLLVAPIAVDLVSVTTFTLSDLQPGDLPAPLPPPPQA